MAKVGLYLKGASGKLAGAVLAKGTEGDTIIRELVKPANPQTEAQATQRMKMAAVCNFYRGLNQILDHSFEGVKYGNTSRMHFMKMALANPMSVAAIDKGSKAFIPLPLMVSQGSLDSVIDKITWSNDFPVFDFYSRVKEWDYNRAADIANLKHAFNATDGQVTFIFVLHSEMSKDTTHTVVVKRIILDPSDNVQDDLEDITSDLVPQEDGTAMYNIECSAVAVIYSKEVNGKWLRSTEKINLSTLFEENIYSLHKIDVAKAMYMKKQSVSNDDRYLNEGDSDKFGSISGIVVDTKTVDIGASCAVSGDSGTIGLKISDLTQFDTNNLASTGKLVVDPTKVVKAGATFILQYKMTTGTGTLTYNGNTVVTITKS